VQVSYPSIDPLVPLSAFNESEPFTFAVENSDPALLSYTDIDPALPAVTAAGAHCFDNRAGAAGGLLHPPGAPFGGGRADAAGAWGLVAIHARSPQGTGDGAYPIGADGTPQQRHYRIVLAERRCIWRYHVIGSARGQAAPAGELVVVRRKAGGAAVVFRPLGQMATVDGRMATVFESEQPLPLLAVPDRSLAFCFRPDGPHGTDVALPYASPATLAADPRAGQGLRADLYFFV